MKIFQLSGPFVNGKTLPKECSSCGTSVFFKQHDFKRSLGITLVVIASLATCVLFYFKFPWLAVWSPMLVVLIFDRIMSHLRPHVLMCQKCQLIFRGIPQEQVMKFDDFDLEVYDRLHYKDRIEKIESSEQ